MRRYIILIVLLLVPLIPIGLFALGVIKRPVRFPANVPLTMWVTNDTAATYQPLIAAYNAQRPYIRISLTQVPTENYANELKDAWARGKGPDLFELPASSIGEFSADFLAPVPATTQVYNYTARKILFRTDITVERVTIPSITIPQLQSSFADVVGEDVIRGSDIYGLPLAIDTLVLYYNKDILRSANIVQPPKTWGEVAALTPKLTVADEQGKIIQSSISIGTGKNVRYSPDIISLLFLQDGVTMTTANGSVLLDESINAEGINLGQNALSFYTSFANPNKSSYAWNLEQPDSRETFIRGRSAFYVGYGSDRAPIEANSAVNFGVAPMFHLQSDGQDNFASPSGQGLSVNYGNYSVLSVFQRSAHANEAWNFIQFITRQDGLAKAFISPTRKVGALRSVLAEQSGDPDLGVFANQAISARSWYHGRNASEAEKNLRDMIDNVVTGKATPAEALNLARRQIELFTRQ